MAVGGARSRRTDGAPPPRSVSLEEFEILKVIGRGSFGKVFLVRKKSDEKVWFRCFVCLRIVSLIILRYTL